MNILGYVKGKKSEKKRVCDWMVIVISLASRIDEPRKISAQMVYVTFCPEAHGKDTVTYNDPRLSIQGKQNFLAVGIIQDITEFKTVQEQAGNHSTVFPKTSLKFIDVVACIHFRNTALGKGMIPYFPSRVLD